MGYIEDIDPSFDRDELAAVQNDYWLALSSDACCSSGGGSSFDVVGYYSTPSEVCIQVEQQKKGLGAELILAAYKGTEVPQTSGLNKHPSAKLAIPRT